MNIVMLKTTDLVPYENNPRDNADAVPYVMESIKQFGFKQPIVVDKDNIVIAGHTRLKAAKKLKLKEVPCIIADDLTDGLGGKGFRYQHEWEKFTGEKAVLLNK